MNSRFLTHSAVLGTLTLMLLSGCKSKQDEAVDHAKKQAAATGQAQQVISVDKNGNTTTTTVQPPAPGQTAQSVTTTTVNPGQQAPGYVQQGQPQNNQAYQGQNNQPQTNQAYQGQNGYAQPAPAPQTPIPGGGPIIRPADVSIAAGTTLPIRINQHISVKSSRAGDRFTGELVEPIAGSSNQIVVPQGTRVEGVVDASHRRGHFKGSSILSLRLTSMYLNGTRYPLDTRNSVRTKKGKGKRSAAFIGGGAGLGMLVGGVATGGVGLLVGGLAGAGAGTAIGGLTGNRDIEIPSESIIRFRLADDLVIAQ
jgi:hypothetical protein